MMVFYWIYVCLVAAPLLLIITVLLASVVTLGSLLGRARWFGYYPGMVWSRVVLWLLLIPVHVEGRERVPKGLNYIYVANHQGAFDIFLMFGYLGQNFRWMMKQGLRRIPFVGRACAASGHIFVDRSRPSKVRETIDGARECLRGGVSLAVFPEGARTFSGHMGYFKRGAFQLADELRVAVVPVTIDGSFEVLPRTGRMIRWHRLRMTLHTPIPPRGMGAENVRQTLDLAYSAIEQGLPTKYRGMVRNADQD